MNLKWVFVSEISVKFNVVELVFIVFLQLVEFWIFNEIVTEYGEAAEN